MKLKIDNESFMTWMICISIIAMIGSCTAKQVVEDVIEIRKELRK